MKTNKVLIAKSDKPNPTQLKSCGLGGYTGPRTRELNETPGQLVNKMAGHFKPDAWNMRPGAADHLLLKSRGV